jgi:hypothetical protein
MTTFSIFPGAPGLRGMELLSFFSCISDMLLVAGPFLLQAQLKETYGPRLFYAQIGNFPMLRDLTDEIWFSKPLFIFCQNNK